MGSLHSGIIETNTSLSFNTSHGLMFAYFSINGIAVIIFRTVNDDSSCQVNNLLGSISNNITATAISKSNFKVTNNNTTGTSLRYEIISSKLTIS